MPTGQGTCTEIKQRILGIKVLLRQQLLIELQSSVMDNVAPPHLIVMRNLSANGAL